MGEVKLYRNIKELLHPSISKKNISSYTIIIDEDILPVQVYYPNKVSSINKAIIYVHGNSDVTETDYSNVYKLLSKELDSVLIAIEYEDTNYKKLYKDVYETVKYLYKGLERNTLEPNNIILMGDSTGCNIITGINYLNNNEFEIDNEILFYPVLSLDYDKANYESMIKNKDFNLGILSKLKNYYNSLEYENDDMLKPLKLKDYSHVPKTLIISGNVDSLKDEAKEYYNKLSGDNKYLELEFLAHGFLKKMDKEVEKEVFKEITKFIN